MNFAPIYDFENAVENACASVVKAFGDLAAFSAQDAPSFQKIRPRVEISFTKGQGLSKFVTLDPTTSLPIAANSSYPATLMAQGHNPSRMLFYMRRESAWNCMIKFDLITSADIKMHSASRAQLRGILASLWAFVNSYLDYHCIQMESDGGDGQMQFAPEKDWFKTSMTFRGKISVQASAWATLISEPNTPIGNNT